MANLLGWALPFLIAAYLGPALVDGGTFNRNEPVVVAASSSSRQVIERRPEEALAQTPVKANRPRAFNRAAVESFPELGLPRRIPLRDAVEGRPPLQTEIGVNAEVIEATPIITKNIDSCDEGDLVRPNPASCRSYQMCIHGTWQDQPCPNRLHWNAKINSCDWPVQAECSSDDSNSDSAVEASTAAAPVSTTAPAVASETSSSAAVTAPSVTAAPVVPDGRPKVICYYTNWSWYRQGTAKYSPADIDVGLCTHVLYGFATLDYNTLLMKVFDSWSDTDEYGPQLYAKITALKKKGIKVLIALGGWNDSQGGKYSTMVNDVAARKRFVSNAVQFIEKYGFEGLDLDWEYPKCWQVDCTKGPDSDKEAFAALVSELRAEFTPRGWLLSAAVSPAKEVIDKAYDVPALSRDLDWIGIMTYDYHGHWDKQTGHVAPLYLHSESDTVYYNANYTINYYIRLGADPKKLIMGIPLYGQSFTLTDRKNNGLNAPTTGPGTAGQFTRQGGFLAYYEICKMVTEKGWTIVQDEENAMGPYAYKDNEWVSFDDPAIVQTKSELVLSMGIGGAMIWALDLDDFTNTCACESYPLLKTINRVLRGTPAMASSQCSLKTQLLTRKEQSTIGEKQLTPDLVVKAGCQDNTFKSHESDCSSYYSCSNGQWLRLSCPGGLMWNKNACDWPANTVCEADFQTNVIGGAELVKPTEAPVITQVVQKPSSTSSTNSAKDGSYKVICYFTNWSWYRPGTGKYSPDDIDAKLCTHIIYGFSVLDVQNLVLKVHDPWSDIDNRFFQRVIEMKRKGVQKVSIGLGGWNDSEGDKYSRLVNDPAARKRFIKDVIGFIEKHGFDGLDLDWEYPTCWQTNCTAGPASDKSGFTEWVKELSAEFKPRGWILSAAVSPSKKVIDAAYDVEIINKYLDWIGVMTYDFFGNWDKETAQAAPLFEHPDTPISYFNANFSMHYWLSNGADKSKLIMGMPMYGQALTLEDPNVHGLNAPASGPGEAGEYTRQGGFLSYYEICQRITQQGWEVVQDPTGAMGPYAYKGDQWTSFDDSAMIRRKSEYVRSMGLAGAMIWTLDDDDFKNTCGCEPHPLLRTINRVLRSYPSPDPQCSLNTRALDTNTYEKSLVHKTRPQVKLLEADMKKPMKWQSAADSAEYKVVCTFTSWAFYRKGDGSFSPDRIESELCTHILYSFASLHSEDLVMMVLDPVTDVKNDFYQKVTALRARGVRVSISLGGWNESGGGKFSRLVNDEARRRHFIESAIEFIDTYGFDGLHLDWQYPKCWQADCSAGPDSDRSGYAMLVAELKAEFEPRGWIISASVSPSAAVIDQGYDVASLTKNLDMLIVSSYDYHGNWDGRTGHVAPLYTHSKTRSEAVNNNVNYTVHYLLSLGAEKKKMVVGMPFYGNTFQLRDLNDTGLDAPSMGPGKPGRFSRTGGFLPYYEICERVKRYDMTVVEDEERTMGPYAYSDDQWVSYDDISTIREKSNYVKALGLGGAMVWALDLDDFQNRCGFGEYPLLRAVNRVLHRIPDPKPQPWIKSDLDVPLN